jgi:hypothetical protein
MSWYERPRVLFKWVRYGEDLTLEYARQIVQQATELNADTLAFCVQAGGYALWDSQATPKDPHLGDVDLIGELAHLCRERGLYFVPWWLGTAPGVARVLREHPSWQLVGPPVDAKPSRRYNYVCYNSPYRELLYEEVREVLTAYEVDGIYFNQLPGSCYCPWCQAKFEQRYGQPMPVVADEPMLCRFAVDLPPTLREFRSDSIRSFCAGIRRIVDEVSPGTCYAQDWLWDFQSDLALGLADVILPEFYQRDDLIPLGLKCRLTKAYFGGGPIWSNVRRAVDHDARHHPIRGTQVLLVNCVANMAAPLLSDQDAMDFDPAGKERLAETLEHIRYIQEVQADAEPVRYAALLHSKMTQQLYPGRFDEAFEGVYRLLFESHVPFEILNEAGVQRGELEGYKVLIIPDAVSLADETVAAVRDALEDGLGLVATYMSGLANGKGQQRDQPALAEAFGFEFDDIVAHDTPAGITRDPVLDMADLHSHTFIWHYGSARPAHPLARGLPEGGLFGFLGGFVIGRCAPDGQIIADIHVPDQVRLSARIYNRRGIYPGPARWPLAVVREYGKARVAYFAPQAEAEWRRAHAPELDTLLVRSILWAGGAPPLEAPCCPWSVDVRLFYNQRRHVFIILLVNLTTSPPVYVGRGPGVIRHVTPQKDLCLRLRLDAKVKAVRSLIGTQVRHEEKDGMASIELPFLDLYDSIVVEYL